MDRNMGSGGREDERTAMPHGTANRAATAGGYPADSHLLPAEMTDPDLIRNVIAGMAPAPAITAPPGMIPISRHDVMAAGLDTLAVSRWLQAHGGYGAVAYLKPPEHKLAPGTCRPALHPVSYFAVPVEALEPPAAKSSEDAEPGIAAA